MKKRSRKFSGPNLVQLWWAYVIIGCLAIFGECRCIYQFCTSDFEPSYKREFVYGLSAVTGFGAITGFFNFHDTPTGNSK